MNHHKPNKPTMPRKAASWLILAGLFAVSIALFNKTPHLHANTITQGQAAASVAARNTTPTKIVAAPGPQTTPQPHKPKQYIVAIPRIIEQVQRSKKVLKNSSVQPQSATASAQNAQTNVKNLTNTGTTTPPTVKKPTVFYSAQQLLSKFKLQKIASNVGTNATVANSTAKSQSGSKTNALPVESAVFLPYSGLVVIKTTASQQEVLQHFKNLGHPKAQVSLDYTAKPAAWQTVSGTPNKAYPQDFDSPSTPYLGAHWFLEGIKAPQTWYAQGCANTGGSTTCGGYADVIIAVLDTGVSFFDAQNVSFTYYNSCSDLDADGTIEPADECTIPFSDTGYLDFTGDTSTNPALNAARLWTNPNENATPQCNDTHGADIDMYVYNQLEGIPADCTNDNRKKEGLPYDDYGHGTFVAALINAQADDSDQALGAAFNATIMPVKISKPFAGSAYTSVMAEAIYYAVDNGAQIINLSFGFDADFPPISLTNAVEYAYNNNVMIVAAAGNQSRNELLWPAAYAKDYANVIAVGAAFYDGSKWRRSSYSNYGPYLTLVAPGGEYSSQNQYIQPVLATSLDCSSTSCVPDTQNGSGAYVFDYTSHSNMSGMGTSYATPLASAGLSLVVGKFPGMQPEDYKSALLGATQDIYAPGYDIYTGAGLLNLLYLQEITDSYYMDKIAVTSAVKHVEFPSSFGSRPVVVARRISWFGGDGGSVVIKNITPTGFDIYLKEWPGFDGGHIAEEVAILAAAFSSSKFSVNRAILNIYETNPITLAQNYNNAPYILLANPWADGGASLAVRMSNLTYTSSDKSVDLHAKIIPGTTINDTYVQTGFFVFDTLFDSGQTDSKNTDSQTSAQVNFSGQNTPPIFFWQQTTQNGPDLVFVKILDSSKDSVSFTITENTRAGQDGNHMTESVSIFYWPYNFTQEYAQFKFTADSTIAPVAFDHPLPEIPMVVANIQTENGAQPANYRLWNITRAGFLGFVEEDRSTGLDGYHLPETIGGIAFLPNSTNIGPNVYFKQLDHNSVPLDVSVPIIFGLQTRNGTQPAWADVVPSGSQTSAYIQENPKSLDGTHVLETLGYLKVNPYLTSTGLVYGTESVNHQWKTVTFSTAFTKPPIVVANIISENGPDPVRIDIKDITANSFKIRVEEPINYDGTHTFEDIVWLAAPQPD